MNYSIPPHICGARKCEEESARKFFALIGAYYPGRRQAKELINLLRIGCSEWMSDTSKAAWEALPQHMREWIFQEMED